MFPKPNPGGPPDRPAAGTARRALTAESHNCGIDGGAARSQTSRMQPDADRELTPHDLELAGAAALRDIAGSDDEHHDLVALAFLRVAWPSLRAQNQ